jgi:DNA polymerase-3 subunit alpha
VPRIDRKLFSNTKKISLCCGNLNGEIPNKILNLGENQAEEIMVEEEFKEDFYIEVMRHNQEDENR